MEDLRYDYVNSQEYQDWLNEQDGTEGCEDRYAIKQEERQGGWCVTCDQYTEVLYHNDTCQACSRMFRRMGWAGH